MRILLDECVPWPLHRLLVDHECSTAHKEGWGGASNGDLIRLAETGFDCFITSDQNIRYQQNLQGRKIAILELSTNDWRRIQKAEALILAALCKLDNEAFQSLEIP